MLSSYGGAISVMLKLPPDARFISTAISPGLGPCLGRMLTWYKLLLAFTFIASNLGNSFSKRWMKSASLRFAFGVHSTSASASMRGTAMYSTCSRVRMYSVHTLPWAPRMYFASSAFSSVGMGS